jgi:hypothetical protein
MLQGILHPLLTPIICPLNREENLPEPGLAIPNDFLASPMVSRVCAELKGKQSEKPQLMVNHS